MKIKLFCTGKLPSGRFNDHLASYERYQFVLYTITPEDQLASIVATFNLNQLHGCCGVCISHYASVDVYFKKRGVGTLLNTLRKEIAKQQGFTVMLCTDIDTNTPNRKILQKNGWKDIFSFVNKRTKNKVNISVVEL